MRAGRRRARPSTTRFAGFMDACVQCRGCESACPSACRSAGSWRARAPPSPTRDRRTVPRWRPARAARARADHRLLLAGSRGARRRAARPPRAGARGSACPAAAAAVGRALRRAGDRRVAVHRLRDGRVAAPRPRRDARRVVEATGAGVALPGGRAGAAAARCHAHAGLSRRRPAGWPRGRWRPFPGDAPILVDSAGCGADAEGLRAPARHAGGRALRGAGARRARVAGRAARPPPARRRPPVPGPVAVQDPCHLRHVQRAHAARAHRAGAATPRTCVELDDEGLCCGAGGAYAALHPETGGGHPRPQAGGDRPQRGRRWWRAPTRAAPCTSPPAGVEVRHPMELVARAAGLRVRG